MSCFSFYCLRNVPRNYALLGVHSKDVAPGRTCLECVHKGLLGGGPLGRHALLRGARLGYKRSWALAPGMHVPGRRAHADDARALLDMRVSGICSLGRRAPQLPIALSSMHTPGRALLSERIWTLVPADCFFFF